MPRKPLLLAACSLLIGAFFGASVFGEEMALLVEKVPSFFVSNDARHPVPVREIGDPGRHAFTFFQNSPFEDDEESHFFRFTVPEGKRLVLESLSVQASLPAGQTLVLSSVQTRLNGSLHLQHFGPTFHGTFNGRGMFILSEQRTLYADGGTEVVLSATRSARDGSANANASVAGHLIDCEVAACE